MAIAKVLFPSTTNPHSALLSMHALKRLAIDSRDVSFIAQVVEFVESAQYARFSRIIFDTGVRSSCMLSFCLLTDVVLLKTATC